jgi:hypothetical protein
MTRGAYVAALLELYLGQPDTPATPCRSDPATAREFHRQDVPFATLAHAIRLATLRRHRRAPDDPPLAPIRSLTYYRRVLQSLTPEDLDPGYITYVAREHARLLAQLRPALASAPATTAETPTS